MGLWNRHRYRQAGKYAKAHYRLAVMQYENSPEVRAARAAAERRASLLKQQHTVRRLHEKQRRVEQKQRRKALRTMPPIPAPMRPD